MNRHDAIVIICAYWRILDQFTLTVYNIGAFVDWLIATCYMYIIKISHIHRPSALLTINNGFNILIVIYHRQKWGFVQQHFIGWYFIGWYIPVFGLFACQGGARTKLVVADRPRYHDQPKC